MTLQMSFKPAYSIWSIFPCTDIFYLNLTFQIVLNLYYSYTLIVNTSPFSFPQFTKFIKKQKKITS